MWSTISRWILLQYSLVLISIVIANAKDVRIVCYYTNWSVYRPGTAKFSPQNINPYMCTHLIYAFGGFTKENTLKPFDKYQDIEKGGYAKFTGLKTYNKKLKTLLAIGGWNEGSSRFSPMVASAERRKELVKNAIKFLRQNHFDGLDLDWEYPAFRDGGKPRDKDNYALLVQELREEFERESEKTGRPRLLLTMAVPAGIEYIKKGYDVPKLTKYLDWMNILSYDYHSAFEPAVNHHAPLYPLEEASEYNYDGELNIDYTIKHYLEAGADPKKLVLGLPTYGRSYTLYNPEANEIGAPADGPGEMGEATRENGYLAYYEICDYVKNNDWKVEQPNSNAMGPYAYKENQWVSYDDEAIIKKKAEYVVEKDLGGIMYWAIDNDDFRGNCHGKPYPLIEAGKEALIAALGLAEENAISESARPIKHKPRTRNRYTTAAPKEDTEKVKNAGGPVSRTRSRIKIKKNQEQSESRNKVTIKKDRLTSRRKEPSKAPEEATSGSSLVVTPSYITPAPPTTPDPGSDFKCEDEGFFPHPRDCKKYFWCLSSGPSDLGIVAHQFTCPSGLYFNKAADSCDYTQNVLCRKKSTTTTTPATTTAKTTKTSISITTARVSPKITAATTRTTFSTTTTEEPEYIEYEYEDEEEEETTGDKKGGAEQDPKVIKELLDIIKRAGGIEELEKQLKIHDDGSASISSSSGSTTQSSIISKSLYERVLNRAAAAAKTNDQDTKKASKPTYTSPNRNSRGPQNDGISKEDATEKSKNSREKPQYTSIFRQRPTTEKAEDVDAAVEEVEEEENVSQRSSRRPAQPEYVTIRRNKPTTTTESQAEVPSRNDAEVNSKLGEGSRISEQKLSTQSPEYVTIRRQRPSTEKSSTSKYITISRGTTASNQLDQESTELPITITFKDIVTTTNKAEIPSTNTNDKIITDTPQTKNTLSSADANRSNVPNLISSSSTDTTDKIVKSSEVQTEATVTEKVTPHLFDPRPFSFTPRKKPTTSTTETTTPTPKVSESTSSTPRLRQFSVNKLSSESSPEELDKAINQRGQSRFTHVNRNRIRSYSTAEVKTNIEEETQFTKPPRVRNPGRNRFTPPTTEPYDENSKQIRTYRPDEIADLSSLTAVDFNAVRKDLPPGLRTNGRRGRPRTRPSTTTTSEAPSEDLKTGSRTLPVARKLLNGTNFGQNSKRVFRPKQNVTNESIPRRKFRTQLKAVEVSTESTSTTSRPRTRKIVRRLKVGSSTTQSSAENAANDLNLTTENDDEEREDILKSNEEGENIKLSESNIKENSDTSGNVHNGNVIAEDRKFQTKLSSDGNKNDEDSLASYSFEKRASTEPNIIIRTRKIVRKIKPTEATNFGSSSEETLRILSTEASKIDPSTESGQSKYGRTRKIIRRLRPTSTTKTTVAGEPEFVARKESDLQTDVKNKKPYFFRRKPTTSTTKEVEYKPEIQESPRKITFPNQFKRRLTPYSRTTESTTVSTTTTVTTTTTAPETSSETFETTEAVTFGLKIDPEVTTSFEDGTATVDISTAESAEIPTDTPIISTSTSEKITTSTTEKATQTPISRGRSRFSLRPNLSTNSVRRRTTTKPTETTSIPTTNKPFETIVYNEETDFITTTDVSETTLLNDIITENETTVVSIDESEKVDTTTYYATPEVENEEIITTTEWNTVLTTDNVPSEKSTLKTTTSTEGTTAKPNRIYVPAKVRPKLNIHQQSTERTTTTTTDKTTGFKPNRNSYSSRKFTRKPFSPKVSSERSSTEALREEVSVSTARSNIAALNKNRYSLFKQKLLEKEEAKDNADAEESEEETAEEEFEEESTEETQVEDKNTKIKRPFANTPKPKPTQEIGALQNKTVESLQQRNKNLFGKTRKMNIPHPGNVTLKLKSTTESSTEPEQFSTAIPDTPVETTENLLTTLHHIFAVTESIQPENATDGSAVNKTQQKIVEISRIVEVSAKEEKVKNNLDVIESKTTLEVVPVLDRLGVVTRITEIKVVDGSNRTKENEIDEGEKAERKDRKFELYGGIKVSNDFSDFNAKKGIEIDSISNVKKITPQPAFSTEATTLALEALFLTESPKSEAHTTERDELLNTQQSNFVKVRLLEQDDKFPENGFEGETGFVPLRILPQDDYGLRAKVVEVIPKSGSEMIKIAPIALQNVGIRDEKRVAYSSNEHTTVVYPSGGR